MNTFEEFTTKDGTKVLINLSSIVKFKNSPSTSPLSGGKGSVVFLSDNSFEVLEEDYAQVVKLLSGNKKA